MRQADLWEPFRLNDSAADVYENATQFRHMRERALHFAKNSQRLAGEVHDTSNSKAPDDGGMTTDLHEYRDTIPFLFSSLQLLPFDVTSGSRYADVE